jgi:hypothetical protein
MAQTPRAEPGLVCPLHKLDMSEVCHKCPWWTLIRGKHPQTGQELDQWGCAVGFLPMLLIENAQMSRGTGAAVESFRNEMVKLNEHQCIFEERHAVGPGGGTVTWCRTHGLDCPQLRRRLT